jgi:hypothetical protein
MRKNTVDPNARKALDQLNMEISQELGLKLVKNNESTRAMNKDSDNKAEKANLDKNTFNPS